MIGLLAPGRRRFRRPAGALTSFKPRVTVVAQGPPALGGIPTFANTLVAHPTLVEHFRMTLLNTTRTAEHDGGAASLGNAVRALADAWRTFRAARRSDIVHVQTALVPTLPLLRALTLCGAARLGGATVVCHVHSCRVNAGRPEYFTPSPGLRLMLRGLRAADHICAVSSAGAATLQPLVPKRPVTVVDNAVAVQSFTPSTAHRQPPTIVYVGTLSQRKGLPDLIGALDLLRENGLTEWQLAVVGGSAEVGAAEGQQIRSCVAAAGLSSSLLGPLDAEGVRAALTSSDIFVLPSYLEGQPLALLEAMAAGLAVVATRVGANPDVIRDGVDGLLVEPGDVAGLAAALTRLLTQPRLRSQLGAAARARVETRHDLPRLGSEMEAVYRLALQRRRASR